MTLNPDPEATTSECAEPDALEVRKRPDFRTLSLSILKPQDSIPKAREIIELGAVRYVDGVEVDSFAMLVRPERGYPARNLRLTGMDPAGLAQGQHFLRLWMSSSSSSAMTFWSLITPTWT